MGRVTTEQFFNAAIEVESHGGSEDAALDLLLTQPVTLHGEYLGASDLDRLTQGVLIGMELVRRYGVLALDDANLPGLVPAEHGPAAQVVLSEAAHRNGYHLALVSRAEFEEFLGLGAGKLTDQQWMELEDRLADYQGYSTVSYLDDTAHKAGWRRVGRGLPYVYRPEGWDQP
jgi:hypothetical protein